MEWVRGFLKGFATTLKVLFRKPATEQYPEYKRSLPARSRAVIILTRDPEGEERCAKSEVGNQKAESERA